MKITEKELKIKNVEILERLKNLKRIFFRYFKLINSHLALDVFARQLLLSGIVCSLTSVLTKLSQHSADTWNLIFFIQPLPLPSDPSQRL